MKKFLGTRIGIILITALVCVIAFSGVAYASGTFNKTVPGSGKVLAVNPDIGLYADSECTTPLESITFADVNRGESVSSGWFYVKNIGNKNFSLFTVSSDLDSSVGAITSSYLSAPLAVGASVMAKITLNSTPGITTDEFSCTISIDGSY